ncbi:huntingtin-interacting protein 1-like [Rhagoletis pomonella]|uniref:huntingtin-interacting protein 1-like n=1 Tax=Rhagoletis pomonella TaxID=28610 RepID=UPI00177D8C5E|nr:huntingtin-interacting protein 1-like [Rhagoletis pomonella]
MELLSKERADMKKHIKKVLNPKEKPFDGLRARTIVVLTHRTDGAQTFMKLTDTQLLYASRFSAWKYCNLMHMAMRFGTPQILEMLQSLKYQKKIYDLVNYWALQTGAIDVCIVKYLKLLYAKSRFHCNYAFFNGALEADITKEWDVNLCFQLCTDIFDYLENLLSLQHAIFAGLTLQQLSVATPQTQCRLQPLINIAAECSILYDQAVDALAVVCAKLPIVDVIGLRNRFHAIYQRLHGFYCALQQVKIILKMEYIPELSSAVPEFYGNSDANSAVNRQPTAPSVWELEQP